MKVIFVSVAALAVVLLFLISTDNECCEKPIPEQQRKISAAQGGDIKEIRDLYFKAKDDKVVPLEEYWALEGALRGDAELRQVFASQYKRMSPERREQLLGQLKAENNTEGAKCLLQTLEASSPVGLAESAKTNALVDACRR